MCTGCLCTIRRQVLAPTRTRMRSTDHSLIEAEEGGVL